MIFGRDLVTCDDFSDCHDKIVVTGVSSTGGQFVAIICKGRDAPRHSQMRTVTLRVIDLVVNGGRGEEIKHRR
jgi:hypothetical protein